MGTLLAMQLRLEEYEAASTTIKSKREDLERAYAHFLRERLEWGQWVSYTANKKIPLLRLFRYKEAFGLGFVRALLQRWGIGSQDYVFDPFCGMGTTLIACSTQGIPSVGIDRLPVACFLAQTLPLFFEIPTGALVETYHQLKRHLNAVAPAGVAQDVAIMKVAFPEDCLLELRRWKALVQTLPTPMQQIFQLLLMSILESCSYTSKDGQFLRLNRGKRVMCPSEALYEKVLQAESDVARLRMVFPNALQPPLVIEGDARQLPSLPQPPTALITSPPYANRYDYTRTYSLELCFFFVNSFEELRALRQSVLRSHIEVKLNPNEASSHPVVREIVEKLSGRIAQLNNPRIPTMITGYFADMERVISEWSRCLASWAPVAVVVDNVRFDGEPLPVDLILTDIAVSYGFEVEEIAIARYKGNSSQQMGKYGRIPVRESVLLWRKR